MSPSVATAIAVVTGCITGYFITEIVYEEPSRVRIVGFGLLGGVFAAIALWGFAFMEMVIRFGDNPSFATNLMFTVGMEGVALFSAWLASKLQGVRWPKDIDEVINSNASDEPVQVWLLGVGAPLLMIYFGVSTLIEQQGRVGTTLWHSDVHGYPAMTYGIAWLTVGVFLHFHFFWSVRPQLRPYSRPGKQVALVVGCLCFIVAFLSAIG